VGGGAAGGLLLLLCERVRQLPCQVAEIILQ
jgi:hypothetical protein